MADEGHHLAAVWCQDKQVHIAVSRVGALSATAKEHNPTAQGVQLRQKRTQQSNGIEYLELPHKGMAVVGCIKVHPSPSLTPQKACFIKSVGSQVDSTSADASAFHNLPLIE